MIFRDTLIAGVIELIERGWVPEPAIRFLIRRLIGMRYRSLYRGSPEQQRQASVAFLEQATREQCLAVATEKANQQHYEVPAEFFQLVLGPHRKYSSCYFSEAEESLAQAEQNALSQTCERARLGDGLTILELGCGWGSLTLWMAERYPNSKIVAVSNSHSQREFILAEARRRKIDRNLEVVTCDINELNLPPNYFDRVVSVEMFEHVRNHRSLLERISRWLKVDDGLLFVHIFCHRQFAYPFETQGAANWMGRNFFTGGMMPSRDLFERYDEHLRVAQQWSWNGCHYQRTANLWAENLDRHREKILAIFRQTYGQGQELKWLMRWKVFFLACAELFGYRSGTEWFVEHYLFQHATDSRPAATELSGDESVLEPAANLSL